MGAEWSIPGFGWTSQGKVTLDNLGDVEIKNDGKINFDIKQRLKDWGKFLQLFDSEFHLSESLEKMECHFEEHADEVTKRAISSSGGKSNGRQLTWNIMEIDPNMRFRLHAHPNIELIYVVKGAMYEYREMSRDSSIPDYPSPPSTGHCVGPDLSSPELQEKLRFERRVVSAGDCLYNPLNSIHISFTVPRTILIVIWGGGHANVPTTALPQAAKNFSYS